MSFWGTTINNIMDYFILLTSNIIVDIIITIIIRKTKSF